MRKLGVYVVSTPEHVRHVLKGNYKNYRKSGAYQRLGSVLGRGLLTNEGDHWRSQRRLAQPAFHTRRLSLLADVMSEAAQQEVSDRLLPTADDEAVDMAAEMSRLTLTIVGRSLLSTDLWTGSNEIGQAVRYFLEYSSRRLKAAAVVPENIPTPRNRKFRRAQEVLDQWVYRIISERRESGEDAGDLLSMLMSARDENTGEGMSNKQVRDEVMTMLIAGHETTAAALGWCWYLLSKHPVVRQKLLSELDTVLDGRSPEFQDLPKLSYTQAVFKETLRLYPPVWLIARRTVEDDEIGGYEIPADSRIVISPYLTHRDQHLWPNPEGFDPERFVGDEVAFEEFVYFPFAGGPRQCIGRDFALMEGTLILAAIAQRCILNLTPGARIFPEASVTLRPSPQVPMSVITRHG